MMPINPQSMPPVRTQQAPAPSQPMRTVGDYPPQGGGGGGEEFIAQVFDAIDTLSKEAGIPTEVLIVSLAKMAREQRPPEQQMAPQGAPTPAGPTPSMFQGGGGAPASPYAGFRR
jgi:hypothetical protein